MFRSHSLFSYFGLVFPLETVARREGGDGGGRRIQFLCQRDVEVHPVADLGARLDHTNILHREEGEDQPAGDQYRRCRMVFWLREEHVQWRDEQTAR